MTRDDALALVKDVLSQIAPEIDSATLDSGADLQADLDLDSMDVLNLVIGVHERTGIDIPERDYPQLTSVGAFADYLVVVGV